LYDKHHYEIIKQLSYVYCPPDIRRWQSYVEPGDEAELQSPTKRISRTIEQQEPQEDLLPLPEGTLNRNLGLDIIVVITKVRPYFALVSNCCHFLFV
jgi:hypothetical protein